jgi:microsomal dipeptidase-like Zn-dependent dipeptidase
MNYSMMAPDDDEILAIKECNGIIGVIFMNYWLSGVDEKFLSCRDDGFENIFNTIKYISEVTQSFDHISIGTDFDGMSDPPDDCFGTSMLSQFKQKLFDRKNELGATEDDIHKILGKNILRVLEQGWVN